MTIRLEITAQDTASLRQQLFMLTDALTTSARSTAPPTTPDNGAGPATERVCACGTPKRRRTDGSGYYCPRREPDGKWCQRQREVTA